MYAKVFAQIFDSSLAEDFTTRHVFMDLLVLADKHGVVDMTPEAIARRTNVPVDIVHESLRKLCKPDSRSRTPDHEGRRLLMLDEHRDWGWQIVNFATYNKMRNEDARRDYQRTYMRGYREKTKPCKPCKPNSKQRKDELAHIDIDIDVTKELPPTPKGGKRAKIKNAIFNEPRFNRFWQAYPRKVNKPTAIKAWNKLAPDDATLDAMGAGFKAQVESESWTRDGGQFIPHPATWLNGRRWEDEGVACAEDKGHHFDSQGRLVIGGNVTYETDKTPAQIDECGRMDLMRDAQKAGTVPMEIETLEQLDAWGAAQSELDIK